MSSTLEKTAATLYHWLQQNNIDPDKVTLVIRANDDQTLHRMEAAAKMDLSPMMFHPKDFPPNLKQMTLHGIRVSMSSLDRR